MIKKQTMSLVVPCYNEEASIYPFVEAVEKVQKDLSSVTFEILFINDGSKDNTLNRIKNIKENSKLSINYLSFSRNFGKEAALIAGLEHAYGEWVAVMDVDLQDPPEMLVDMYHYITEEDYDVVATRRSTRKGEPFFRSVFAKLYYRINNWITDVHLEDGARDYRLMTRQVVDAILELPERNRFSKGIFAWVGFNVKYLEYENIERKTGQTSWSFYSLFNYALEGIISFSDAPLTIASIVGFITFLIAIVYGFYIIVKTLMHGATTPGWPSLAVLILGMSGLQLLCLGIVGKYIGKIFHESKHRPHYIVKESSIDD